MTRFPVVRNRLLIGHFMLTGILCAAVGLAGYRLAAFPPDAIGAVGLVVLALGLLLLPAVVYRIILLLTAWYEISPAGSLTIRFGARKEVLPIDEVEEIRSGGKIPDGFRNKAPGWMDVWQGPVVIAGEEPLDWLATDRRQSLLLLVTKNKRLAISPSNPAAFARLLATLSSQGSLEKITPVSSNPSPLFRDILHDRAGLGLWIGGLLGMLSLGVFLTAIQPGLPAEQPFQFDSSGAPTSLGDPARLLILPLAGGAVWLVNVILGWWIWRKDQRPAAYAFWIVSVVVAVGLWVAALALILMPIPD